MADRPVRIRMYRQGFGDCFLLTFPCAEAAPRREFHMLIDCGVLSGVENAQARINAVVDDIAAVTGGILDLVVVTHEHWDHVSGFLLAEKFKEMRDLRIERVWLAWTEDPDNPTAQALIAERQEKIKALQVAVQRINAGALAEDGESIRQILGFYGPQVEEEIERDPDCPDLSARGRGGGTTREALRYLTGLKDAEVHYCYPSRETPHELAGVEDVRVYIFGPPEDLTLLKMSDPTRKGKETYGAASIRAEDSFFASVLPSNSGSLYGRIQSQCYPFDEFYHISLEEAGTDGFFQKYYLSDSNSENAWRRIDNDWLSVTGGLALNLDSDTNNTSLALAIELGAPGAGKVLLFPADAQVGNWLSWKGLTWSVDDGRGMPVAVTVESLLKRTVLYKVGHHGSHNATLRDQGLELMMSEDLVAMLPVDRATAEKRRWNMPFPDLYARLLQKTRGRVLRLDTGLPTREQARSLTDLQWQAFVESTRVTDWYIEYCINLPPTTSKRH